MFGIFKRLDALEHSLKALRYDLDIIEVTLTGIEDELLPKKEVVGLVDGFQNVYPGKIIPVRSETMEPVKIPIKKPTKRKPAVKKAK